MKAVIFVGGFGTRLRPLTCNTPKAMVPVYDEPFIHVVLERLKAYGITDVILAISHLSNQIEEHFGDGCEHGMHITYVHEDENNPLGTGGALKNAAKYIDGTFLAMNGDIVSNININRMLNYHKSYKAKMTIALHKVDNPSQYGLVKISYDNKVESFIEKPKADEVNTDTINAGIYIMEPEILDLIPEGVNCSLEHETFPKILSEGLPFYAYVDDSYWLDIGTPEKYFKLLTSYMTGELRNNIFHKITDVVLRAGFVSAATSTLKGPIYMGKNALIKDNVFVRGPVVIGDNVIIEEGARLENVILWDNAHIGKNVKLNVVVGANNITFEDDTEVSGTVIGDNVVIRKGCPKVVDCDIQPDTVVDNLDKLTQG